MVTPFALSLFIALKITTPLAAKDLGTRGSLYPIMEEDPVALIQQKLKGMEETGELAEHNNALRNKVKIAVERPVPVPGITKATTSRVFYYDPTFVVERDYTDQKGKVFARKGTRINPLEKIRLPSSLIFFDGDDPEQLTWVETQLKAGPVKLILTGGSPLSLAEKLGKAACPRVPSGVYFDQGGLLVRKLGIQHVPAQVTQDELRLRIEEIPLQKDAKSPSDISYSERHTGSKR